MLTAEPKFANDAITKNLARSDWRQAKAYRLHLLITKDDDDSYSAIVLNLPGVGSSGSTAEEAVDNAREAIQGALKSYNASGDPIPWKDTSSVEIPAGASQKWIIENA